MRRLAPFLALLACLLVGLATDRARVRIALAGNGDHNLRNFNSDTGQDPDRTYKALRTSIAVADTLTTTNVLSLPVFQGGGRPTIFLQGRFSNASDSCTVQIAYVNKLPAAISDTDVTSYSFIDAFSGLSASAPGNKIKFWSAVTTLTGATSNQKEGSYYESNEASIDMLRSSTIRVAVISAPTHTVDLWLGS